MTHKTKRKPIDTEEQEEKMENQDPIESTEEKIKEKSEWQIKAEEYLVDLKRTQADFENYKKRQGEAQKDLRGMLIEKLVLDIVPVLDNFRSATMHVPPEQKSSPWVVGIQYIEKQLEDVVKQNGVEVIEVKEGDTFDPSIHEALEMKNEEAKSPEFAEEKEISEEGSMKEAKDEEHKIAKVLQNGFRLGGKVIRPAKVIIK
ncbi:MAG: nucleotide exchange factor GrpE [Candidatus Moranbacteria bacterium CG23_combo_of_CG06-09_8_20_14_all_41_28]|nr:MAG: nucleotide exchange factor GrpE [Candidatus Moranbacteria bacterium CG23_combo_of_CG06-09_8_20_14_all_41_28]